MPRKSTAWAATCAAMLLCCAGCRFFGIDNRPDIRYVTEKQRKEVKEPMYSMAVPGTGLFKQWPMRLGPDYGYAPWEKKPGGAMAANSPMTSANPAVAANVPPGSLPGAGGSALANAPETAVQTPPGVELTTPTAKSAKPSLKATPRMADGNLAGTTPANMPPGASADLLDAAEEYSLSAKSPQVNSQQVNPAVTRASEAPQFRPPVVGGSANSAAPAAAASRVAKAGQSSRSQLPPADKNLPWQPPHQEVAADETAYEATAGDAGDYSGDEASDVESASASSDGIVVVPSGDEAAVDLFAGDQHAGEAPAGDVAAAQAPASTVTLQQPGAFAARKVAAVRKLARAVKKSPANPVRDEAVRPASANMPAVRNGAMNAAARSASTVATRRSTRSDIRVPTELASELVPPSDDSLDATADPLSDVEAERPATDSQPYEESASATRVEPRYEAASEDQSPYRTANEAAETYSRSKYLPSAAEQAQASAGRYTTAAHGEDMLPRRPVYASAAPPNHSDQAADDEPVFVTASDMGDEDVPVASSRPTNSNRPAAGSQPMAYENPYARSTPLAEYADAPYTAPSRPASDYTSYSAPESPASNVDTSASVMDQLRAVKQGYE